MYPQYVLSKNMKIVKKSQLKIVIFTAVKYWEYIARTCLRNEYGKQGLCTKNGYMVINDKAFKEARKMRVLWPVLHEIVCCGYPLESPWSGDHKPSVSKWDKKIVFIIFILQFLLYANTEG